MKLAVGYAVVSSVLAALQYAPNEWRRPVYPHVHILATVALNLVGAVFVGLVVDALKRYAVARWRAACLGFVVALPLGPLVYFTVYPRALSLRQFLLGVAITAVIGAVMGAAAWLPDEDY